MPHYSKEFAKKINHCLDETDAPNPIRDRAVILSKLLDIPRQQAWGILEGQIPESDLLQKIANEFEVDVSWLSNEVAHHS